jgi:hypothetical protein
MGWNSQTQTTLTLGFTHPFYLSGVLYTSSGIGIPNNGKFTGIRGYTPDMLWPMPPPSSAIDTSNATTFGRSAVLALQLLRMANNRFMNPIIEYCMLCPGSSWVESPANGCGGLGPGSAPWINMHTINDQIINKLLPSNFARLNKATFRSVGWTQGGSLDLSSPQKTIDEWSDMTYQYDMLFLPGTDTRPLNFYIGIRAPNSNDTVATNAVIGAWQFVRTNQNGRTIGTSPWYQWKFNGGDGIHTDIYGVMREGEFEGLAKYITEDEGVFFKPLWRSLTLPITITGQTITIPFDRPTGSFFTNSQMLWMAEDEDGPKEWPQKGFHVRRGTTELTVTPIISGMNVVLTITEPIRVGDSLEVSYAYRGPGGPPISYYTGVGGNLTIPGPPSQLFPGKIINSWAWPFMEMVTV